MAKYKNAEMHRHSRLPGLVDESASLAGIAQPAVWNNKQEFGYYVSSYYIPEKVNWIKIKCWAGGVVPVAETEARAILVPAAHISKQYLNWTN